VEKALLVLPAPPRRPELWLLLRLPALPPPPHDLGIARPRHLRLDESFRLPPELDLPTPPRSPPPRRVRPRTPLARAPLSRFSPRKFRLDASAAPANGNILRVDRERGESWVLPRFRRQYLDLPWMARDRVAFLGPLQAEWFLMWWDQSFTERLGPGEPEEWSRPDEVDWAMDTCKEQMLIRRDVVKDERAPEQHPWSGPGLEHAIVAWNPVPVPELVPAKEWVSVAKPHELLPAPRVEPAPRDAYLEWRALVDALGER
jgi:hypothetical protein